MAKRTHEFRDPVHVFIRLNSDERKVVDSEPFQRLRHVHQLAMTYLVYPGATHRRFEHSLGCMELASRIFDTITRPEHTGKLPEDIRGLPDFQDTGALAYWRKVLRLAALCHDLGHLPFSHAAEELLPAGVTHETMTKRFIMEGMADIWASLDEPRPEMQQIAKIAVGEKEAADLPPFTPWESILSEIITGDIFGADRMDYLLRDSLHAGVTYGHFDHHRLIDTMRILPGTAKDDTQEHDPEPELGIEYGGKQVAESLLVARYLMFSQVYFHPVRRIYDLHLKEFLKASLPGGTYPVDLPRFVDTTDNEVLESIRKSARDANSRGHDHAARILKRRHFKKAFHATIQDCKANPTILSDLSAALVEYLGQENVMSDDLDKKTASKNDFPIRADDGRIISAHNESGVMTQLPLATTGYVFVKPELRDTACRWVKENVENFYTTGGSEECAT